MTALQIVSTQMDHEQMWSAVLARDARYDGQFVYAVRSTGVFCRPGCPSRRPGRSQATFFGTTDEAQAAGYRACLRCQPDRLDEQKELAMRACEYIDEFMERDRRLPPLADVADALGASTAELRRVFKRHVGVTAAKYARGRRLDQFKSSLRSGATVSDAVYGAGFGSGSRVYENSNQQLGMTPASYRKGGAGAIVKYVATESALGGLLVAGTNIGICAVKLGDETDTLVGELRDEFPAATLRPVDLDDDAAETKELRKWTTALLDYLDGEQPDIDLPLDVLATAFQWRVWRELQSIPAGETRTYQQLAAVLDHPTASRAVGRACATNPVAPIIPCHRAVRKDGGLAGYRWGLHRKEALLEMERRLSG